MWAIEGDIAAINRERLARKVSGIRTAFHEKRFQSLLAARNCCRCAGHASAYHITSDASQWPDKPFTSSSRMLIRDLVRSVAASSLTGTSGYGLVTGTLKNSGSPQSNFAAGKVQYLNAANATTQALLGSGESFGPTNPQGGPGNQTYTIASGGSGIPIGVENRGIFRAPFQERWDATLSKNFPLKLVGDSGNLEFRTEAFKLLNNTIFNGPNSQAGSASFGQITSTIDSTGRQLQFALKLTF